MHSTRNTTDNSKSNNERVEAFKRSVTPEIIQGTELKDNLNKKSSNANTNDMAQEFYSSI